MLSFQQEEEEDFVLLCPPVTGVSLEESIRAELSAIGALTSVADVMQQIKNAEEQQQGATDEDKNPREGKKPVRMICPICYANAEDCPWVAYRAARGQAPHAIPADSIASSSRGGWSGPSPPPPPPELSSAAVAAMAQASFDADGRML